MTRRHGARFVAVAFVLGATLPAIARQAANPNRVRVPPAIERAALDALAAYAGGDDFAVEKWLASADGARTSVLQLEVILQRTPRPWQRSTPAFLLEAATGQGGRFPTRNASLVKTAAAAMVGRPAPPGVDPDGDRFELLWFQAALGLAQDVQQYWLQQDLIDLVRLRFGHAGLRHLLAETRIPLAEAIAAGGLCCWQRVPGETHQWIPPAERRSVSLNDAIALFEQAAAIPAVAIEARVRGAVLLAKMNRKDDALRWFAQVPPHTDPAFGYVHQFTLARLLDGTDRAADAAAAYSAALTFEPRSQPAAIGLAASLLRQGRTDDAAVAALTAHRNGDERAASFESGYRRADARFVRGWLTEVRKQRR